jgi:hypothetical protein
MPQRFYSRSSQCGQVVTTWRPAVDAALASALMDSTIGESTKDDVDFDESNYKLESQNQKIGKMTREM